MDLSALIFVALAVAWAVYLVPKALRHHEVDRMTRSVESFSDGVRVLARREAVSAGRAELVVDRQIRTTTVTVEVEPAADTEPTAEEVDGTDRPEVVVPAPLSPAQRRARRAAAARAARRRRRVLGLVLLANLVVVGLAVAGIVAWPWVAAPAALLVAWLVACRLMVRRERAVATVRVRKRRTTLAEVVLAEEAADGTDQIPVVTEVETAEPVDPDAWDPVPVTLPTYVAKASAGRSVRTIDLDSTGVWSSGRNASDSALAREADQQRSARTESAEARRVSGA